jgi:hypothetical protein
MAECYAERRRDTTAGGWWRARHADVIGLDQAIAGVATIASS